MCLAVTDMVSLWIVSSFAIQICQFFADLDVIWAAFLLLSSASDC